MWHDWRGERRSCKKGREQALLDEGSAGVTGGKRAGISARLLWSCRQSPTPVMPALDPDGNACLCPSDNSSACLSVTAGLFPPVIMVLAPASNICDHPPVMPALAPLAMPALSLSQAPAISPPAIAAIVTPVVGSFGHPSSQEVWSTAHLRLGAVAPARNASVHPLPKHFCFLKSGSSADPATIVTSAR